MDLELLERLRAMSPEEWKLAQEKASESRREANRRASGLLSTVIAAEAISEAGGDAEAFLQAHATVPQPKKDDSNKK